MLPGNSAVQSIAPKPIRSMAFVRCAADRGFFMRLAEGLAKDPAKGLARGLAKAILLVALTASPALAQRVPAIVIPGRQDVPVIIDGVDASWAVVEGDYGLDRPIGMVPTVIYRPAIVLIPANAPNRVSKGYPAQQASEPGYFPSTGERPGYGRLEVVPPPNRLLPPPAQPFFQSWSGQSAPGPVTEYPPYPMPQIIWNGGWGGGGHRPRPPGPRPPGPGPMPGPQGPGAQIPQ
jgi:hypothetical protein